MAWVRIHDGAMTHPKIASLSDKSFRLWVWGLSHAQLHLTDGRIAPTAPIPTRLKRAAEDLTTRDLWHRRDDGGFQIHDYLDWNDSKEFITRKRSAAKDRMSDVRLRTTSANGSPSSSVRTHSHTVPCMSVGLDSEEEKIGREAARFCDRFVELYREHRRGAFYHLKPNLDWSRVCSLLKTWEFARLEKLAVILLTTDEHWISGTDRGIGVFVSKASWCDDRLREWEAEHDIQVTP